MLAQIKIRSDVASCTYGVKLVPKAGGPDTEVFQMNGRNYTLKAGADWVPVGGPSECHTQDV